MNNHAAAVALDELIEVAKTCRKDPGSRGSFRIVMFDRDIEAMEVAKKVLQGTKEGEGLQEDNYCCEWEK